MSEQLTHWKKFFDYRFLYGEELEKETTVIIERYDQVETFNQKTNEHEMSLVIYFKGAKKGLLLNKLNTGTITAVLETPYVEKWIGKKIIIMPLKGRFFGSNMTVVRVKKQKP